MRPQYLLTIYQLVTLQIVALGGLVRIDSRFDSGYSEGSEAAEYVDQLTANRVFKSGLLLWLKVQRCFILSQSVTLSESINNPNYSSNLDRNNNNNQTSDRCHKGLGC